jgi:hypothetical protein
MRKMVLSARDYRRGRRLPRDFAGAVPASCGVTGFTGRGNGGMVDAAPIRPPARIPGTAGFGMSGCAEAPRFRIGRYGLLAMVVPVVKSRHACR